jgi:glutamate transport system permease protein
MRDQFGHLYDAPGPRARRITWVASIVFGLAALAGLYLLVYRPLDDEGQLSLEKWGPLVDPSNESFRLVWGRIATGFLATLIAAAAAVASSLLFGTLLAILRVQLGALRQRSFPDHAPLIACVLRYASRLLTAITRFCVEVFRGLPVLITIFLVARGLPEAGILLPTVWFLVIGLTIYNMVVIGEILRSGMEGLPRGQAEAASALGLSSLQTTLTVLLPQACRIMLPALVSQLVVVLKDTSLGFIISYEDTLQIAKQIIGVLDNPIQLYFVIGALFILVNYALSRLAGYVQHRLMRGRKTVLAVRPTGRKPEQLEIAAATESVR